MTSTHDDVTAELTGPGEALPVDPFEEAWNAGDGATLEALAKAALAQDADAAAPHAWLGLSHSVTGKTAAGQASLKKAFELWRARLAKAASEEERHQLTWALHAAANRLVDTLAENPTLGLPAAHFVVEALGLDHPPSLRLLAEEKATKDGDAVGAQGFLKRALALDATDPETHYLAARLLARVGRKPNVMRHLEKAIEHGAGLLAVRTLARYEPDFDGFRSDPDFTALLEVLPKHEALKPLYVAFDAGEVFKVLELAPQALPGAAQPLDVLYPWRDALELLLESGDGDATVLGPQLERVRKDVEALEAKGAVSEAYRRFTDGA